MSKEIKIDEILTRSKKQKEEREAKKPSITIDGDTGEEMQDDSSSHSQTNSNPFDSLFKGSGANAFGGIDPKLVEQLTKGQIPGYKNLPLKQRIMFKVMRVFGTSKGRAFLKKRWWPLWAIVLILLFAVVIVIGIVFGIFKLIKLILGPYIDIFRPKK